MTKIVEVLALDRGSVRSTDQDGRLHVAVTNISKAAVNPYRGSEIPDAERLGLDPARIYQLLRDPVELARGAASFNNIPVLIKHVRVSADDHQPGHVVGSTGTDAAFADPYLTNSLVVWEADAIAGIEQNVQRELSSAYRYDADMTPGTHKGVAYDGVMRNIRGNHIALVASGRAGSDVIVGDQSMRTAKDAEFKEGDHPRGEGGQFGAGTREHHTEMQKVHGALQEKHADAAFSAGMAGNMALSKTHSAISAAHGAAVIAHGSASHGVGGNYDDKEARVQAAEAATSVAKATHTPDAPYEAPAKEKTGKRVDSKSKGFRGLHVSGKDAKPRPARDSATTAHDAALPTTKDKRTMATRKDKLKTHAALRALLAPKLKLAQDADIEEVIEAIETVEELKTALAGGTVSTDPDDMTNQGEDGDAEVLSRITEFLTGKLSDEDLEAVKTMMKPEVDPATDADMPAALKAKMEDDKDKDKAKDTKAKDAKSVAKDADKDAKPGPAKQPDTVSKTAMDAAIDAAVSTATQATINRLNAIKAAEKAVRPYVGELAIAQDSAEGVFRLALDTLGIDVKGVPGAALPHILAAQPMPGAAPAKRALAMDAASAASLAERFPDANRLKS